MFSSFTQVVVCKLPISKSYLGERGEPVFYLSAPINANNTNDRGQHRDIQFVPIRLEIVTVHLDTVFALIKLHSSWSICFEIIDRLKREKYVLLKGWGFFCNVLIERFLDLSDSVWSKYTLLYFPHMLFHWSGRRKSRSGGGVSPLPSLDGDQKSSQMCHKNVQPQRQRYLRHLGPPPPPPPKYWNPKLFPPQSYYLISQDKSSGD